MCPSVLESFCRVAAEAMLNGIPVVGSDLAPIRALLGDDEAGLLFPVGDTHRAAEAIARLVADGGRTALGAAGGGGRRPTTRRASVASCSLYGVADHSSAVNGDADNDVAAAVTVAERPTPRPNAPHHAREADATAVHPPTHLLDRGRPGRDRRKPDSALVAELGEESACDSLETVEVGLHVGPPRTRTWTTAARRAACRGLARTWPAHWSRRSKNCSMSGSARSRNRHRSATGSPGRTRGAVGAAVATRAEPRLPRDRPRRRRRQSIARATGSRRWPAMAIADSATSRPSRMMCTNRPSGNIARSAGMRCTYGILSP